MSQVETLRQFAIILEVEAFAKFIKNGLKEVPKLYGANDFSHLPILLLSNGFERLLKCIILLDYYNTHGSYPTEKNFFKKCKYRNGHGLDKLLQHVIEIGEKSETMSKIPLSKRDLNYLKSDSYFSRFMDLFTDFATNQRYYNLNSILKDEMNNDPDPFRKWDKIETDIFEDLELDLMKPYTENAPFVNLRIVHILSKGTSALVRFFTHADLGKNASMHYGAIAEFHQNLYEEDFQTN